MDKRNFLAAVAVLVFSGCAALPSGKPDPRDRFERFNRSMYALNTKLDHAVLRPLARTYKSITPAPVRRSVRNFMTNIGYPGTIVNQFLQGKPKDGTLDTARLIVNTIFGIGGLFDPASHMGLELHNEDFGQTLGKWGVPAGPYLVLPFFVPSTVRDTIALVPDEYTNGRAYISDPYVRWSLYALDKVDKREQILDADEAIERAFDPYAFVRNAWLAHRDYLIHDGNIPDTDPLTDPEPDSAPSPAK